MSEQPETESVIIRLQRWAANDAQIAPDHFACPHYEACNASVEEKLQGGEGC